MTADTATVVLDTVTCRQHLVDAIADAGSDHAYQLVGGFCFYAAIPKGRRKVVRCLVGEILHRAGVPDEVLRTLMGSLSTLADAGALAALPVVIDPRLLGPLAEIQRLQDEGRPWSQLLPVFDAGIGYEDGEAA